MFAIEFEPVGRRGEFPSEQSLLDCARQLNVDLVSVCGGFGICGRCKVQSISGDVGEQTEDEKSRLSERELAQNYRLACRTHVRSDATIHVPPESLTAPQRTQVEGLELAVEPEPLIRNLVVRLSPPSLDAPEADDQTLWAVLLTQHGVSPGGIDFRVQQTLSSVLRKANWHVCVAIRETEIVALGDPSSRWLGLAADIGTTKIAVYLVDLESGKTLASRGLMNPQISYGEDIIARLAAAEKSPQNAAKLQSLLVEALNEAVESLCSETRTVRCDIVDAVIVGNTAIHHMLLKLPVRQLGMAPYVPAVRSAVDIKARDIELHIAAGAYAHLLPNIAGFVGADHVAMLLAAGIDESASTVLAVDIGTNTEICLNHRGTMRSVSCASGPAFEGAHIKFGMRAAPGAIEHVRLTGDNLSIQTIEGKPPVGVCGSGLLDVVAQLRLNNIIDGTGRMGRHPRVRSSNGGLEFVLAETPGSETITISQKDVRELQLAKAAIRVGIRALVEAEGLSEDKIDRILLAGAFGTYIDVESAIEIGMLPPLPLDRFRQIGNAAGTGARMALISQSMRGKAQQIALRDGYIEVGRIRDFNRKFAESNSMTKFIA